MSRPTLRTAVLAALALLMPSAARAAFTNFESGQVRPLALSPSQGLLFACNTPDNRLAVYTVAAGGLTLATEVPVGLEPVAVATRALSGGRVEAWVVNHLSDSVSIVEVDPANLATARVTRTVLVGDEPRDIVFAGPGGTRAFITAAHRGQNRPGDPQLTTEGIGRADVWVFEATALGAALGGTPVTILTLFGDTPRGLATDGNTVYAAVFHSGNRTTAITETVVSANGGLPPNPVGSTPNGPETGLIVRFNPGNNRWEDEIARNWSAQVAFNLPDQDVFLINANANPPASTGSVAGVGTVLFNMAVRPMSAGQLYVTNTEARNHIRFEPVLRGHLTESRVTVINGTTPTPVHLNPHINYNVVPGPQSEIDNSLAFPTDLVFTPNGQTVFVAGLGSGKVGVFSTSALEAGNVNPRQLLSVGQAPSGLAYDSVRDRLYVLNRIDRTISIVSNASLGTRAVTGAVSLRYDAEPASIRNGRRFLYDARGTSGHGDSACFSCHIYGDLDSIAWDLGDPFGSVVANPNPFRVGSGGPFHPIKGPMATQTLRGMANNGPMHWRGDRTGGSGANALNEDLAFKTFNPAFVGLLGRGSELDGSAMQSFTDFILTVVFPPNPIRVLSNTLTGAPLAGSTFFQNNPVDGGLTCNFCHRLPLGSDGLSSIEGETQEFKIAHLRNDYQKIGMFGFPGQPNTGDQVRGFGVLHDGSIDTVNTFLSAGVFNFPNDTTRRNVEQFVLGFDTGLRPMVGQQVTVTPATVNDATVIQRITDMIARDNAGDCDLVVKGTLNGVARGAVFVGGNNFQPDRNADPVITNTALRALAGTAGQELTYTCVPPGNGARIGIDRDEDGFFDRTEIEAASDPADPLSFPGSAPTTTTSTTTSTTVLPGTTTTTSTIPPGGAVRVQVTSMTLKDGSAAGEPKKRKLSFTSSTKNDPAGNRIVAPVAGAPGDPSLAGATLRVYNPITHADDVTIPLVNGPDGTWTTNGSATVFKWKGLNPDGPVKRVILKADKLTIRGGKALWPYTLGEASQGSVALRFQAGSGPVWCAQAGQSGFPPKIDIQDKFAAMKKTPAPAVCP